MRLDFGELLEFFDDHLRSQVMPFWLQNCIDTEYGGINNIVADDGTVLSTDKFLWSQGRALWTFSGLFTRLDGDKKWLEIAKTIADFIKAYGRTSEGEWVFKLHRNGSVAEAPKSIYVDAFVATGMIEYARATGDQDATDLAIEIYRRTSKLLTDHSSLPTAPHPIPDGLQSHGPSMIFAYIYHELGILTGDDEILDRAYQLAEIVMTQHLKPEDEILYEFVKPGGDIAQTDAGQTFLPGHIVESMWFLEKIYHHHDRADRVSLAMDAIRWSLEKGWDHEYGGIYLALHAKGGKAVWHQPDAKVWWAHTEALYALLRAYEITGESWCLDWYWRVHEYAFDRFPNRENGEWFQNLDRKGHPIDVVVKNLAVKDPFHLPRALIMSIEVLRRLI
jgi:N-acylglucosamine 2-epimerase